MVFVALHFVVALMVAPAYRRLGKRVFWMAAVAPAAAFGWLAGRAGGVLDGEPVTARVEWIRSLGVTLDLRLDGLALLMGLAVSGIGVAVLLYCLRYFGETPGLGRLAAWLTAFAGSMLGLVLADNLLTLYLFWELTTVTSFLLIGFEDEKGSARAAAIQAVLVTTLGGLAMLGGFVLLGREAGTYSLSGMLQSPPAGTVTSVAVGLILVGAFTKSAQVPFHSWLPGAMAAPTPVSTYLHSATMVKAGVYLIARLAPAFAATIGFWRPVVVGVGLATMVLGGWRALRQHDLKLLLAFGTLSQLGFMVALFGFGEPALTYAGVAVILAHALFKATLFLVVGIVDHQAHTRSISELNGLGRQMPLVFGVAAAAAASMAGLPPLLGFIAKEVAFDALLSRPLVMAIVVAASLLTFAYSARFVWGAFATRPHRGAAPAVAAPRLSFVAPALVLAILTVGLGLVPRLASGLVEAAAASLDASKAGKFVLWPGFKAALGWSVFTMAAGAGLFVLRDRFEALQSRVHRRVEALPTGEGAYRGAVSGLNRLADRLTSVVQSGSLPIYLGVILLTVVVLPGAALLGGASWPSGLRLADSTMQAVVALLVVGAGAVVLRARRRLVAVIAVGAVGYGVAGLFIIHGAPDLALTQLVIETLGIVMFVLVLSRLPALFRPGGYARGLRVAVAGAVGVFVFAFALIAAGARTVPPVSDGYLAEALPEGGGRNVVNVILVDFRAFDTLGEITVLAVAALGIGGLVATLPRRRTTEEAE